MQVLEQLSALLPQKTPLGTTAIFSYSACFPKTLQIVVLTVVHLSHLGQAPHAARNLNFIECQTSKSLSCIFPPTFF